MPISESELLFTAKAQTSQAKQEFSEFRKEFKGIEKDVNDSSFAFEHWAHQQGLSANEASKLKAEMAAQESAIKAATGAVIASVAAIGVMIGVSITAARELFNLTTEAAEFGSKIYDASQKTGLGAEALSALKFAADQSGSSFEQVTKGVTVFGVELGKMAQGDEKAADKMKLLKVTSTDLHTALGQVFKTIADAKNPTDQLALASEAFGKKIGPDLIPLIKDANGNFEELIKKATELGVTISDKDAAAADQFGDQMDLLKAQVAGVARTIGFEFMPTFLNMSQSVSGWLIQNKGEITEWASRIATVIEAVIRGFGAVVQYVKDNEFQLRVALAVLTGGGSEVALFALKAAGSAIDARRQSDAEKRKLQPGGEAGGTDTSPSIAGDGTVGKVNEITVKAVGNREAAMAEAHRKFNEAIVSDLVSRLKREYDLEVAKDQEVLARLKADRAKGIIDEGKEALARTEILRKQSDAATVNLTAVWQKRKELNLNAVDAENRLDIAIANNSAAQIQWEEEIREARQKTLDQLDEVTDKELHSLDDIIAKEQERFNLILAQQQAQGAGVLDSEKPTVDNSVFAGPDGRSPFDVLLDGAEKAAKLPQLANIIGASFNQMAQGVGAAVKAFVLFGTAGGGFKKFAAEMIASIAQMAAIQAVWELAQGFAMLALAYFGHPMAGPSATQHFIAAGVYGAIAGVAAIAGRAVAGDSFKQQSAGAYGTAGASGGGSSGGTGYYSKYGDDSTVIPYDRNTPEGSGALAVQQHELKISLEKGLVVEHVKQDVRNNGSLRLTFQDLIAST